MMHYKVGKPANVIFNYTQAYIVGYSNISGRPAEFFDLADVRSMRRFGRSSWDDLHAALRVRVLGLLADEMGYRRTPGLRGY